MSKFRYLKMPNVMIRFLHTISESHYILVFQWNVFFASECISIEKYVFRPTTQIIRSVCLRKPVIP